MRRKRKTVWAYLDGKKMWEEIKDKFVAQLDAQDAKDFDFPT